MTALSDGSGSLAVSDSSLVLLSLDYLRELRRSYPPHLLKSVEHIDADYLSLAVWSLNRAFTAPPLSQHNDPYLEGPTIDRTFVIPALSEVEKEILDVVSTEKGGDQKKEQDELDFCYEDSHESNDFRFYALQGLAATPLTLGEVVAAGLQGLQGQSRQQAESALTKQPLFQQYLQAVQQKGFFDDPKHYHDRYRKTVAKYRTKLAMKNLAASGDVMALKAAEQAQHAKPKQDEPDSPAFFGSQTAQKLFFPDDEEHPMDFEEAEKHKAQGNLHMQRKEFQQAVECYSQALKISPAGPQSHVYFSNRAAAHVSLKKFNEAIVDSERSLSLKPEYGKAHARLGLAYYLLGNYRQAMEAYTVALKMEPDNKSSKNYLEKAAKRLAETGESGEAAETSFSVVSQWDHQQQKTSTPPKKQGEIPGEREAEKYKTQGNAFMANRDYVQAVQAYSFAIDLSPDGPSTHVYYSNRAAALCYLEKYQDAEADSLTSLEMNPSYGKAHARLGLSRFFLQDYAGAVDAYTAALKHDPNNAASKSYLAKAKAKLESISSDATARRLVQDPDIRSIAAKVMSSGQGTNLLNDPELHKLAKKALNDPAIQATVSRK